MNPQILHNCNISGKNINGSHHEPRRSAYIFKRRPSFTGNNYWLIKLIGRYRVVESRIIKDDVNNTINMLLLQQSQITLILQNKNKHSKSNIV